MSRTSVGDPLVGHVLDDRYQITGRLARGGMATVYQALDTRLTRTVAVKVMHVGLGDDAEFAKKFDREARAAARLSHPNVVSVFDQGRDNGRPYIVMEFVDGRTLRDVITREAPLTPLRALEVIEPVLNALACAHDAGLVHRDVKPENVLISDRGQIKVADFGLAKAISAQTSTATAGLLIGTVSYLPPELVVSGRADARSDVYSAGVVLFELITGTKPHTGETPIQVAYAHVHQDVPPPSSRTTAGPVPPYLDALLARVTARNPDLRPPDAKSMLTLVRRVRAALREGLADDQELTQDLTLAGVRIQDTELTLPDGVDAELTQLVHPGRRPTAGGAHVAPELTAGSTGGPRPWAGPAEPARTPEPYQPYERSEGYVPVKPAVLDAPPPVGARPLAAPPDRLGDHQRRVVRRRRRGWLALFLVLLLATAAAVTGWYYTDGRFTSAPALTSLTQDQAVGVARSAGLGVAFESRFSESVSKGVVIATVPTPGAKVLSGDQIRAWVSSGPERHAVPRLAGLSRTAAGAALASSRLTVGRVRSTYSATVAEGVVLAASPSAGTRLKRQTPVDLTLSAGPRPIPIPGYEGERTSVAQAALEKAGFTVKVTEVHSATVPAGKVVDQRPSKGTGFAGDTVRLKSSLGPVMVTVPWVQRKSVSEATRMMAAAGFKVRVKPVLNNFLSLGYVSYSVPAGRTQEPLGSTITLFKV